MVDDLRTIDGLRNPVLKYYWGDSKRDTWVFGAWLDSKLAGFCCFTGGETYRDRPNNWPLQPGEAELTEVATMPEFRGRGVASRLIVHGVSQMNQCGYSRFFARVWHSNYASMAAFRKAGWTRAACLLDVTPRLPARRFRFVWPRTTP